MGADIGARLHGDGQALDGVGQLLMQVVVHAQARGVGGLVGEAGKAGNIQFFICDSMVRRRQGRAQSSMPGGLSGKGRAVSKCKREPL